MPGFVYILASKRNGTLYIGVTSDLARRIHEHREGMHEGFAKRYGVKTLVHYEVFDRIDDAIHREKIMKEWKRAGKLDLIERNNPLWLDLYETLNG
jgi:putative endonuclease